MYTWFFRDVWISREFCSDLVLITWCFVCFFVESKRGGTKKPWKEVEFWEEKINC